MVRWDSGNGILHLIQTLPLRVTEDKYNLFLKAAQKLNHGFLFPGIGVNLENGGTYYRLSIPVQPRGFLFDYELGAYNRFAIQKAKEFYPTLEAAVDGKVTIDELILHHQKR